MVQYESLSLLSIVFFQTLSFLFQRVLKEQNQAEGTFTTLESRQGANHSVQEYYNQYVHLNQFSNFEFFQQVYFGDFFPYTDESAVISSTEKWFSMKLKM
jgi:hypothetical protein